VLKVPSCGHYVRPGASQKPKEHWNRGRGVRR